MAEFDPTNTTVEEIHDHLCEEAAWSANDRIFKDDRIPRKWKGYVIRNNSPYNEGRLSLAITEEYHTASDRIKSIYRAHANAALRSVIVQNGELFAGMVFGEARVGRNYFERWQQAPTQLF